MVYGHNLWNTTIREHQVKQRQFLEGEYCTINMKVTSWRALCVWLTKKKWVACKVCSVLLCHCHTVVVALDLRFCADTAEVGGASGEAKDRPGRIKTQHPVSWSLSNYVKLNGDQCRGSEGQRFEDVEPSGHFLHRTSVEETMFANWLLPLSPL